MVISTTPTHTFTLPMSLEYIEKIRICYAQKNKPKIIKELDDCTIVDENKIEVALTQNDTKEFVPEDCVQVQLKILTKEGKVFASNINTIKCEAILDDEVM